MVEHVIRYAKIAIVFVIAWVLLGVYNSVACAKIQGGEMEPAIDRDSLKLLNPQVRHPQELNYGDVVSFTYAVPGQKRRTFAARVVGRPGDRVKIEKGEVYLNGQALQSSDVSGKEKSQEDYQEIIVPRDTLYLLCDARRSFSKVDSRAIGPVGYWAIDGKVR